MLQISWGITLAGPVGTIGALIAIAVVRQREGYAFSTLGLGLPDRKGRPFILFKVALFLTALLGIVVLPWLTAMLGAPEPDSRFDYMQGNTALFILPVVGIAWFAAAFGEEVVWRGYFVSRLAILLGSGRLGWLLAIVISGGVFGALHIGLPGQITAAAIGIIYGFLYWLALRNLWPLIVAHAVPDTLSFISMYQGG